jgi:hypothetical protein
VVASLQMRRSVVALLTALSSILVGQPKTSEPIKTTLCELVGDPEELNNRLVEIRSEFVSRFQWEGFCGRNLLGQDSGGR